MNNIEDQDLALARLRAKLYGETNIVVFTRTDGRTVTLRGTRVESIGPRGENPGVIGVEFENDSDRIVHLPFIESWEVEYL